MSDHRITLPSGWRVWKWVELRSAGFNVGEVSRLAAPATSAAADAFSAQRTAVATARERVKTELAAVPTSKGIKRALHKLHHGGFPDPADPDLSSASAALAQLVRDHERAVALQAELATIYDREDLAIGAVLCGHAADPQFREALLWQNRSALHTGVDWLRSNGPGPANGRRRQNQHLVASYLQRYCTKNDTIGFFGPFGFGEIVAGAPPLTITPGPKLLGRRTVYFEHWTIDVLAQALATDPALRRRARPRRMPSVSVDGNTVHYGFERKVELPELYARLLAALDGRRTAEDVARAVTAESQGELVDDDVLEMLESLADKQLCTWTLEVPTPMVPPQRFEGYLDQLLVEAGPAGEPGRAALAELDAKRIAVAEVAGDVEQLDRRLGELNACFERLTTTSATRRSGQTYAGRTVVYEECRRDMSLVLGPALLSRLDDTLRLMLTCGRWYTHHVATRYRELFDQTFDQLAAGGTQVPYLLFWRGVQPHFPMYPAPAPMIVDATLELQRKWAEVIDIQSAARRLDYKAADLAASIERVFAAPGPGWPDARYHSPDIMLAAPSADVMCNGGGLFVLGEFHPSVNTIQLVAQREHDDPHALIRAREIDIPESIATMVISKEQATRGDHIWLSRQNIDVELGPTRSWRDRDQVIAVADLRVERDGKNLVVRDRAGRHAFDIVAFHGNYLTALIGPEFNLMAPMPHRPRITIGDVVVAREQWRCDASEVAFATLPRGPEQFAAARAWANGSGMPRHVFVKVPEETKPVYVDFDSPIYVEMLSKIVRKASRVVTTEMLPGVEEAWLPDAAGRRYTSEIRFIAVDPLPWKPPA